MLSVALPGRTRADGGIRTRIVPVYETGAFLHRATSASAAALGFEPSVAVLEAACSPRSTLLNQLGMAESNCRHVLPKHACRRNTYPQWTYRESNPDLLHARQVSSRWTISPGFNSGPPGN